MATNTPVDRKLAVERDLIEKGSLQTGKWANLGMAVAGIAAAYSSHSDALLVDGLYSGVNFVSAILAVRVSVLLQRSANHRQPFGFDAYEALYVKYRSLVLLGIMVFAMFGAISKIVTYASGGKVPDLVFGPIIIYMFLMILICFGLAFWHRRNWILSGRQSELLSTESRAAVVDGVISAAAGAGLLLSTLLTETPIEFIVPIADAVIVLVICAVLIRQPYKVFFKTLGDIAGSAADQESVSKARVLTEKLTRELPATVLEVSVTKLGRTYFVVPYLKPDNAVEAQDVDAVRKKLDEAYRGLFGVAKTEVIITAQNPFQS